MCSASIPTTAARCARSSAAATKTRNTLNPGSAAKESQSRAASTIGTSRTRKHVNQRKANTRVCTPAASSADASSSSASFSKRSRRARLRYTPGRSAVKFSCTFERTKRNAQYVSASTAVSASPLRAGVSPSTSTSVSAGSVTASPTRAASTGIKLTKKSTAQMSFMPCT
eukprot:Amastigsp_a844111_6.p2 type:complete len:170 gc:universal Amastigsp_a844111_6:830-321(-)